MKRFPFPVFHSLIDFVYPPFCIVCDGELGIDRNLVCPECWGNLEFYEGEVCHGLTNRHNIDEIMTAFVYDDAMKKIMHYLKYKKATRLGLTLAEYMVRLTHPHENNGRNALLIPVPLHKIKFRERGYNQSGIVAGHLSRLTGIPCREDVMIRVRNTVSQTRMSGAEERARNVSDIFKITDAAAVSGKTIILLDDVVTTGATANAAAGKLKERGADKVILLTIAHPILKS